MSEEAGVAAATGFTPAKSLKRLSMIGAAWTMGGYGFSQLLRLASNLALTRLLAPEYFGLMALVNVFMIGLEMFSDIGVGPNIIQSKRGNERGFLDTAWTIQIIRGVFIWLCCVIGAWPFAEFYGEPMLMWLIPVAGFGAVIGGFTSTNVFSANRSLLLGRLTTLEIGSQIAATLLMISMALAQPTIWVLVVGSLFGGAVKTIASHFILEGARNRLCWDASASRALIRFGKWIFLSTALTFVFNSAGSLILGKFMPMAELGLFTIASTLAKTVENLFDQIGNRVLLPIYSQIKHLPIPALRARIKKVRLALIATFLPPLWLITLYGQELIDILFDSRYHDAGWIFRTLAAGAIFTVIAGSGPFYLAIGNSFLVMKLVATRLALFLSAIILGWWLHGVEGIIIGMAAHTFLFYTINIFVQRHYGIWIAQIDALALGLSAAAITAGLYAKDLFL